MRLSAEPSCVCSPIWFHRSMPDIPPDRTPPLSRGSTAAHAVVKGRHHVRKGRHLRKTLTLASVALALFGPVAGCSSHKSPDGDTRTGSPTHSTSPAQPSPTDTVVVKTVPSIVPFVGEALKKLGVRVPLQVDKAECHPGSSSHIGSKNDGQLCRWSPDDADSGRYRILSVSIVLCADSAVARQELETSAKQQMDPKPVALGDEAMAGAAQAPDKTVTIRGHDQDLALTGANLAVRVHNVSLDIIWLGTDYTVRADGTPTHMNSLTRQQAIQQSITIAKAIIAHIK